MYALAALPVLALATSASAANIVINVGAEATTAGGIFQFMPPNVTAQNGDVVTFMFSGAPGNHSITQSGFTDPCNPLAGGFDSGWVLVPTAAASPAAVPTWNLTITDNSKPIWFYCKQLLPSPHCKAGMVGSINAPATGNNTFDNFKAAAIASSGNPGQGVGALVGVGASASAPPGPIPSGDTLFGTPAASAASAGASATAPAGSGGAGSPAASSAGSSAPAPTTNGGGSSSSVNVFLSIVAAVAGIAFA